MKIARSILLFVLSMVLTALVEAFIVPNRTQYSALSNFLLLIYGGIFDIPIHIVLFSVYVLLTRWLLKLMKESDWLYLLLAGLAVVYLLAVLIIAWNLSRPFYKNFSDYLYNGIYYTHYALVVVLLVTSMRIYELNSHRKNNSVET